MSTQVSTPSTPSFPNTPDVVEEMEKLQINPSQEPTSTLLQINGNEDEELERFRAQWREELKAKKAGVSSGVNIGNVIWKGKGQGVEREYEESKDRATLTSPKTPRMAHPLPAFEDDDDAPRAGPSKAAPAAAIIKGSNHSKTHPKKVRTDKERAVQTYAKAVESEQSGQLNEALILYRRAFKMDVAKATAQQVLEQQGTSENPLPAIPNSADIVQPSAPIEEPYSFQRHIQLHPDYVKSSAAPIASSKALSRSALTAIFDSLPIAPYEFTFLPEDEDLPIPIANLPAELIDPILAHLDVIWVERFAATCWRARYLTQCSNVWRRLAHRIYREPAMLPPGGLTAKDLVQKHAGEWRTTLIEEERVRMDGCYIAVCHYIPSEVVPILRPSLRGKGLHFGRWRLIRPDAIHNPEIDPEWVPSKSGEKRPARIIVSDLLEPGVEDPKYEFEMELALRQTSRGRWNKLDILEYRSINLTTGETLALSLKNQKPFFFSK
ncbi:F-box protein 9 [Cryptococcus deuterogattii 2001/935-1]|nr:F-box protein 9 [Cryptococcus deuterogattii 2001/935-1]